MGQRFHVHFLARHGGDNLWPVHEQRAVLAHHGNVAHAGDGGGDAAALAQHHRDLRHHAGQLAGLAGHQRVGVHRVDALIQARAGGVQQREQGRAGLSGQLHHLQDLPGVGHAYGAALNGEILGVDVGGIAVDQAVAGDDAGVRVQHIQLHEAGGVQQQRDALPGQQLPGLLLLGAELRITLQNRQLALANDGQILFHFHFHSLHRCVKRRYARLRGTPPRAASQLKRP